MKLIYIKYKWYTLHTIFDKKYFFFPENYLENYITTSIKQVNRGTLPFVELLESKRPSLLMDLFTHDISTAVIHLLDIVGSKRN